VTAKKTDPNERYPLAPFLPMNLNPSIGFRALNMAAVAVILYIPRANKDKNQTNQYTNTIKINKKK